MLSISILQKIAANIFLASILSSVALAATQPQEAGISGDSAASFTALSARADAARDADRIEEAERLYNRALALRPQWVEGWWSLGTIAYDRDTFTEAVRAFQKVTALAPKNGNAYIMLGLSEFELGRDSLSLQHLEKGEQLGISEDPNLIHVALYHQGVLLQRAGKFQAAQETLQQLCLQGVQSAELAQTLGMVLLRMTGRQAPEKSSTDAEIVARVGDAGCLAGQKKFDDGKKELSEVVQQHPSYPNLHYALGIILLQANDPAGAEVEFKEEIRNNPADVVSRLQIAAATYKINSAEGLPYAEEAVKLAPSQPFAHYLLGLLLLDTDDYPGAIPELEIARKAFPSESKIYLALGTAYSRAGRKQEAAQARAAFSKLTEEKTAASTNESQPDSRDNGQIRVGDMPSAPQ
jgi:predicted Zn-dependent protease